MSETAEPEPEDEIPDELAERLGFENARRIHMRELALSGADEVPELEDFLPADARADRQAEDIRQGRMQRWRELSETYLSGEGEPDEESYPAPDIEPEP
jgi:hypothetical protein